MNRSLLLRSTAAILLALGAVALGQTVDTSPKVPGACYVARESHGFDALANAGAKPVVARVDPVDGASGPADPDVAPTAVPDKA